MKAVRTSIHAAVWGWDWSPEGIAPSVADAAELGYDYVVVPLRRFDDIQPAGLACVFAAQGISPLNTCGLPLDKDVGAADPVVRRSGIAHLRQGIALARDMGSTQINGVLYGPIHKASRPLGDEAFLRAADAIREIAGHAAEAGVRLALEVVNRYETPLLYNTRRALRFLEAVAHDNVYLHLDTYHMSIEEAQPLAMIEAALPRLAYLELDQSHRGDAYDGSIDLVQWCHGAALRGYRGIVGVEAFSRQFLAEDHANALAIWEDQFADSRQVAAHFMQVIREGFGG